MHWVPPIKTTYAPLVVRAAIAGSGKLEIGLGFVITFKAGVSSGLDKKSWCSAGLAFTDR